MNTSKIYKYQRIYGIDKYQELINTGTAWQVFGKTAKGCLKHIKDGTCILPTTPHKTYWGQYIPSRYEVLPNTPGSFEYVKKFYEDEYNHTRLLGFSIQNSSRKYKSVWQEQL